MKTGLQHTLGLAACISLSMLAQQALAAPPGAAGPGGHVDIIQVAVDFDAEIIAISGHDFDFGEPLVVRILPPFVQQTSIPTSTP